MIRLRTTLPALAVVLVSFGAVAGSLENLERERALTVETLLDPALSPGERQARLAAQRRRLIDLERLVLRDDGLRGAATPAVRRAFADYDLTFLAHAATERDLGLADLWLGELGVTSESLMSATIRRR